jgi:hypothetical protein
VALVQLGRRVPDGFHGNWCGVSWCRLRPSWPGFVPAIHVLAAEKKDVDAWRKVGHDESGDIAPPHKHLI